MPADWFLLLAVVPLLGSLGWIRRFNRLAGLIEAEADYAQRQRERASQQAELASSLATRPGAGNVETPGGLLLRTLSHPAEGVVGGDFVGTATADEAAVFVISDVAGHGLEAAITALRLKDLILAAAAAGLPLADAPALGNAHLWTDPSGKVLATVFVARYDDGVLSYANAGYLPGHLGNGGTGRRGSAAAADRTAAGPGRASRDRAAIRWRWRRAFAWWSTPTGCWRPMGGGAPWTTRRSSGWSSRASSLPHERLNARRPERLRDDLAAVEFLVPSDG